MRAKLILPAIAAGLVVLAGCDIEDFGGFERYHEDFHYSYPLKAGGRLAVDGFNGSVEVSVWDQETVDISGTKYARSQEETADLKIEIDHSPDSVSIRAIRPSIAAARKLRREVRHQGAARRGAGPFDHFQRRHTHLRWRRTGAPEDL